MRHSTGGCERPRGATPRPRSGREGGGGAAERRYPASEVRGGRPEELPHAPTPEARGGGREEQPTPEARGSHERSYPEPWLRRQVRAVIRKPIQDMEDKFLLTKRGQRQDLPARVLELGLE